MFENAAENYSQAGPEFNPDWHLTTDQIELRKRLIQLCLTKIRIHAVALDEGVEKFPWAGLEALAEIGLLGLLVPRSLGGMGENHTCAAMVVETIARYGCPATAMVFVMHLVGKSVLLLRYHDNEAVKEVLRRCCETKPYLGSSAYSDPTTGAHFWYPFSSKVQEVVEGYQLLKYNGWCTSAGFAEWYAILAISPNHGGDASNVSCYLIFKEEVRANVGDWRAMGMHGNQSGPMVVEGTVPKERMIGPPGDGKVSNDEAAAPVFHILTSAVWMGISLACLDVARKHCLRREHVDTGMRVADYPTIQDYFGECTSHITAVRHFLFGLTSQMDAITNNHDVSKYSDLNYLPRLAVLPSLNCLRYEAAKLVSKVGEKLLHACGGIGYKKQLGLERLVRDGKAGWVMAPNNEVLRQFIGQLTLFGVEHLDPWCQKSNSRLLTAELRKLSPEQKEKLGRELIAQGSAKEKTNDPSDQSEDFYNPLIPLPNQAVKEQYQLVERRPLAEQTEELIFRAKSGQVKLQPGQYVEIEVRDSSKKPCRRYMSPTSPPNGPSLALAIKYENRGVLSQSLQLLKPEDSIAISGPCGGYEYRRGSVPQMVLICSGVGITPAIQIIRTIAKDPQDKTRVLLFYHAETPSELLFRDEIQDLSLKKGGDQITVEFCVSENSEGARLREGFMGQDLLEAHLPKLLEKGSRTLLCGGPSMVLSSLYSLRALGHPSNNIYIYGPFGAEFLKAVYGRSAELITKF